MATGSKRREKNKAIVECLYHVPDTLCSRIRPKDVTKSSRTTLKIKFNPCLPDVKTLVIGGTRSQIRHAIKLITEMTGEQESILEKAHILWRNWVEKAFPNLDSQSYFLPPVCIKRLPLTKECFAGQKLFVVPPKDAERTSMASVRVSDEADDHALHRILFSLKTLSIEQKEVFVCLSQFPFGSYLGEPEFIAAAANLPVSSNLPKEMPWSWRRGDFDVLIIHRQYGFVLCEMKAVGYYPAERQEDLGRQVTEKLFKGLKQLDIQEAMLSHLVSDIADSVPITKVIACPNLTTSEVEQIVFENQQLVEELRRCFKIKEITDIQKHFLCSNHLMRPDSPQPVSDDNLTELKLWWQELFVKPASDQQLHNRPDFYRTLVARFCGPASTVTVPCVTEPRVCIKTWDQAVSFVGDCYTGHMTLFPEQLDLLSRPPPRAFIVGPPGTGKTVVLLLMAAEWVLQGNDVRILSTWDRSLASTLMLAHLLQEIIETKDEDVTTSGNIYIVQKDFRDKNQVDEALDELTRAAGAGPLYVIADEVGPEIVSHYVFSDFCSKLLQSFQDDRELYFWATSCHLYVAPDEPFVWKGWERRYFTRPLRSPPTVAKEIEKAVEIKRDDTVPNYDKSGVPDHGEAPSVNWFFHPYQQHGSTRAEECDICGGKVASFLTKNLRMGESTSSATESFASDIKTPTCLRYSDVLILCWVDLPEDSGIVKALRQSSVPVRVVRDPSHIEDITDVATARSDVVWAVRQQLVRGLERKVVVVVDNYDDSKGEYVSTRLHAMSRCSSQLVVVCPPPGYETE